MAEDKGYPTWEELVAEQANGWVAVIVLSTKRESWPWVCGPYPTQRAANNARVRMRRRFRTQQQRGDFAEPTDAKFFVRPLWKETPK